MKKKILFSAFAVAVSIAMVPKVFAADLGTVKVLTQGGKEEGTGTSVVKIKYDSELTLKIDSEQEASGNVAKRPAGNAWIGIEVTKPNDAKEDDIKYYAVNNFGVKSVEKSFKTYKDTESSIQLWSGINFEVLNAALKSGKDITYSWFFNWDGDEDYDQEFQISISPENVKLQNKEGNKDIYPVKSLPKVETLLPELADTSITGNGTNFVTITYSNPFELEWVKKDQGGENRPVDGWWVGVRFNPGSEVSDVSGLKYKYRVNGGDWSTEQNYEADAGQKYMSAWILLNEEKLTKVTGDNYVFEWTFDWDKDGEYEQTVTQVIPVKNVKLTKEGETVFEKQEEVEGPKEEVPDTYDGVLTSVVLVVVSVLGLGTATYLLKKKKEN